MIPLFALSIALFALSHPQWNTHIQHSVLVPKTRRAAISRTTRDENVQFGSEAFWDLCSNLNKKTSGENEVLEILQRSSESNHPQWHEARDCSLRTNGDSYTILQYATLQGATQLVEFCLQQGANPNVITMEYESTPLKWAANRGYTEIVRLLLQNDADQNIRDFFGYTPLQYAALGGHADVTKILLGLDEEGENTLEDLFELLNQFSISSSSSSNNEENDNVNAIDEEIGFCPLHLACSLGRTDLVEALLELDAMVDQPTNEGRTPLFFAVGAGHDHLIELLVKWGANLQARTLPKKTQYHVANPGWTLLHEASQKNRYQCVKVLLQQQQQSWGMMDVNVVTVGKETPLLIAVQNGNNQVAQILLDHGANVNQGDDWNTTPLHTACRQNYSDIVQLLLRHGADVHAKNNYHETPMHHCAWLGHVEVAQLLIKQAVVTANTGGATDTTGVKQNNNNNIQLLLEAKSKDQQTPLDYATKRGHNKVFADLNACQC